MDVDNVKRAALCGGIVDGGFSLARRKPVKEVIRQAAIGSSSAVAGSLVGELMDSRWPGGSALAKRLISASTSIVCRHGLRSVTEREEEEE